MATTTVAITPTVHAEPTTLEQFRPCDWVTTTEVADIFGIAGTIETDGFVPPGSVEPHCIYRSPGRTAVSTTLSVAGAFPIDAAAEYSNYFGENTTAINGFPQLRAHR